jgi:hypothetical protein
MEPRASDTIRKNYSDELDWKGNKTCYYDVSKRMFSPISGPGRINLTSERLELWEVLCLMCTQYFIHEDFEFKNTDIKDKWKPFYCLKSYSDTYVYKFLWERD